MLGFRPCFGDSLSLTLVNLAQFGAASPNKSDALKNGTAANRSGKRQLGRGNSELADSIDMTKLALLASDTPRAQEAKVELESRYGWVPIEEAETAVVLGGDGYMLHALHSMLDSH